jgi:hypothetical protein
MKTIGQFPFPETPDEARSWKAHYTYHALASKVIVTAKTRVEGAWVAYIDAVQGQSHEAEWHTVLTHGNKLWERVALAIFPEFEGIPYAH